jgi:glycerol-3-phosphate acyltransferase PlsY
MPQAVIFVLLFIGAYLLGSVPITYLIAKWARGIDLRQHGSGNVGVTNLIAATSVWFGIPAIIFDLGKGVLAVYAARWLGLPLYLQGLVGIGAIIGHSWPVFLKFNAGRGVLTTVGVALAIEPILTIILVFLSLVGISFHQFPVTALISIFLLSLTTLLSNLPGINSLFINNPADQRLIMALVFFVIFLFTPIRRLTVPVSSLGRKISRGELMVNRLLFDRDIRNRKEWLSRNTAKNPAEKGNSN